MTEDPLLGEDKKSDSDTTTTGNISDSNGVAIGSGARVEIHHHYAASSPSSAKPAAGSLAEISDLIRADRIKKALEALQAYMHQHIPDEESRVILQFSRWNSVTNGENNGTITPDRAEVIRNQIKNALLALIKELERG